MRHSTNEKKTISRFLFLDVSALIYGVASEKKKEIMPYLVESHGQCAGDGETLTILEAALDGGEVADGQVQLLARRRFIAPRPQILVRGERLLALDRRRRRRFRRRFQGLAQDQGAAG